MEHLKRIKPLMEALEELWQRYPTLRLTQLLSNAARADGYHNNDLYFLTDENLLTALKKYPEKIKNIKLEVCYDNS